jgi:hypothetical protein
MSIDTLGRSHARAGASDGGQYQQEALAEASGVSLADGELTEPQPKTFDFPARRLPEAIAKIEAANKKLERAGIADRFTYTSTEYLDHSTRDEHGHPRDSYELRAALELSEPSISYGGWTFVAALDATEGGFIARTAPGQSLDGWRPDAQLCDHCGLVRHRKSTYIVRDRAGATKQIGSNCLEPFLGVEPKGLWALGYDFDLDDLSAEERDPSGHGGPDAVPTRELMAIALAVSDGGKGFVSKAHAMDWERTSTSDAVSEHLYGRVRTPREADEHAAMQERADAYLADGTVDAVLATARDVDSDSDYGMNLQIATSGEWVSPRHSAIAVSAVAVWRRTQERAAAKATITQGFAAPEKAKIAGIKATITKVSYQDNPYDYNGGVNTLVIFQDEAGHQVKWFASGRKDFEIGQAGTFTGGTVKEHAQYQGVDQTVVTRVKFEPAA